MSGHGGFFIIDRRTWGAICDSCSISEAAAYLLLAQGTGACNRLTSWSATALKKYVGMSWNRAQDALRGLTRQGFIRHAGNSSPGRPRYELIGYHERCLGQKYASLSGWDRAVVDAMRRGETPPKSKYRQLEDLEKRGLVERNEGRAYALTKAGAADPAELIWLPNTVVVGTSCGEDSPVHRLRGAGDLWVLRLFVDLYHAHNLSGDGGISPSFLRQGYKRSLVGEQGIYAVWGFSPGRWQLSWKDGPFASHRDRPQLDAKADHPVWSSVNALVCQGLLSFVPHLWEHDPEHGTAEVIHAYGLPRCGEPIEVKLGTAACNAALAMVPDFKLRRSDASYFAPVPRTLGDVQMVGVARLRYRPHTRRTRDWWGDLNENAEKWMSHYQDLRLKAESSKSQAANLQ